MPIYAYRCAACGHAQDVLQRLSDPVLTQCPVCGAEAFSKQVTAAGFQLKGSGWYATDFRNAGQKPEAKPDGNADAKPDAKPDAGSEGAKAAPAEGGKTADAGKGAKPADGSAAAPPAAPAAAKPSTGSSGAPGAPSGT